MELSLVLARDGSPTCAIGGSYLHSKYEPAKEALRFAQTELKSSSPACVIILGPCLGYLCAAVRTILPGALVLAIQYSPFFAGKTVACADAEWLPGRDRSLESFLDGRVDEDAISGVAVLEWEPASRAFPEEARAAREAVRASLDRLASSTATVKASGRRWIANACASYLTIEKALRFSCERSRCPVLLAAAGPSLRQSLLGLAPARGSFATVAVSSALSACLAAGIEPDLVVATDGGFWSRSHLYPLARSRIPLAAPLTALPSASLYRTTQVALLDQGSFAEAELLAQGIPALSLPPHGTVSGSALSLAARLTEGPILAAGLDLASYGEIEHSRPHGFDPILEAGSSRLSPVEGALWSRAAASSPQSLDSPPWRYSRSLEAYASALSLDARALAGRLFRITPSPVRLEGFQPLSPREACLLASSLAKGSGAASRRVEGPFALEAAALPPAGERAAFLASRLASWRDRAREACACLVKGRLIADRALAELLRSIDIVDYAAARRAALSGGDPAPTARELARRSEVFLSALEGRFSL